MKNTFAAYVAAFVLSTLFGPVAHALIITGATATSTMGPPTNELSRTVTRIFNEDAAATTVTVEVSDTGFAPAVSDVFTSASGTFANAAGSTITFNWYIDRANALSQKSELIDSFTFAASDSLASFSHNFTRDLLNAIADPYSMTMAMVLTLAAGGELTNLSQTEQSPVLSQVPEPACLALLGLGLAGLALSRRRRV